MMFKLYPDVKAEDFAIHWQARLLFPHSSPDWLTPLPGKPGRDLPEPQRRLRRGPAQGGVVVSRAGEVFGGPARFTDSLWGRV